MNHADIGELLSAYANDEVSRTQREFVEEHLLNCLDCRDDLAEYREARRQLTALRVFSVPSTIGESTMNAIRAGTIERGSRMPRIGRPVMAAAAVVAAIAIALTITLTMGNGPNGIAKAHDVFAELDSYRMIGTTKISVSDQEQEIAFDWIFAGSERAHGTLVGPTGDTEFIQADGSQYVRSSFGSTSTAVVLDDSLLSPVPSREGTLNFLSSLTDVNELSDEQIAGVDSLHYSGAIDLGGFFDEQLAKLDAGSEEYERTKAFFDIQRQSTIHVELWIAKADNRIQRMNIDARLASASSNNGVLSFGGWTTYEVVANYREFNKPVDIAAPVTATGQIEPGWHRAD